MYNTRENKEDKDKENYTTKLIVQYPDHFIDYYKLEKPEDREKKEELDMMQTEEEDDDENDEDDDEKIIYTAPVPMLLDSDGYITYITQSDGQCTVKEINPKFDMIH